MADAGEGDIAALLEEEHDAIRAVAAEVLPLARAAAAGTLADADFDAFKRGVLEIVERQVSHIQKETMALLPHARRPARRRHRPRAEPGLRVDLTANHHEDSTP